MTLPDPVVLTVGSLHYDIMVEADRLPRRDETAVGSRWYPKFGGKGGNQAVSARRHGAASRMVSAVGADEFGRYLRARLQAEGVDHRFVADIANAGSGISVAILDAAGDYAATIVSGANLHLPPAVLNHPEVWQDVALLVLQNEVPAAVNLAALQQARRRGIATVLNAAPFRDLSPDLAALVDILVVNAVEAEMMTARVVSNLASAADAARVLCQRFGTVIVTAGSQGLACCRTDAAPFTVAAEKVVAVSSHGAGDAFVGALAARLCRKDDLPAACRFASVAAARHVAGKPVPLAGDVAATGMTG